MILGICSAPEVLEVMRIVQIVIKIIQIAVPILLIIYGMILFTKAISDSDAESLSKSGKSAVRMAIAAAIIFFVPTFVYLIFDIVGSDRSELAQCITDANVNGIANSYLDRVGNTFNKNDYQKAEDYINSISDEDIRNELLSKLNDYKGYVDLVTDIQSITSKNFSTKNKSIQERIEEISDTEIQERIQELYTNTKKDRGLNITDYPIDPNDKLYSDLTKLEGKSIKKLLEEKGSSVEELNSKIELAVESAGVGTREGTVAAAMTLIGTLAEYGYKLPYYWGGGQETGAPYVGINSKWGAKTDPSKSEKNTYVYSGLDCSGFASWAIMQSVRNSSKSQTWNDSNHTIISISGKTEAVCELGDTLENSGHVTLVVGIDEANKRYIVAQESDGLGLTTITFGGIRYNNEEVYKCYKQNNYKD